MIDEMSRGAKALFTNESVSRVCAWALSCAYGLNEARTMAGIGAAALTQWCFQGPETHCNNLQQVHMPPCSVSKPFKCETGDRG